MSTGNKILLAIGGVLIIALIVVFFILPFFRTNTEDLPEFPQPAQQPQELVPLPSDQDISTSLPANTDQVLEPVTGEQMPMSEAAQRAEVERLTRLFVERFGSYSNFSNFENITSIEQFMTDSMKSYAEQFKQTGADSSLTADYYGVTTRLINSRISSFEPESAAVVDIIVQQEVQDGLNAEIQRSNRDGRVELAYQEGEWLISGLFYNN
jgi:hypothetical protein